jgi:hypothetical protein
MSYDWFEFARMRGAGMLWTEDWFPDRMANRWSYFAARMRSATVLAAPFNGSSEFSGYIVPRSGGQQAGGLLRRAIALVGGGAKALRYFQFGPEYTSPSNCYSESSDLNGLFREMRLAHAMIASAESTLWEARRPRSQTAILMPRSSGFWDDWEVAHPTGVCLCCCVNGAAMARYVDYTAETYGSCSEHQISQKLNVLCKSAIMQ